ncbi:MAG: hypothetical protein QM606_07685 [Leucobacter sp.]
MTVWIVTAAVVLLGAIVILSQVIRGFSEFGPIGEFGEPSSCTFDHEPTDAALASCADGGIEWEQ